MRAVPCPRCQAVCLLAMVDGFKAAVDPGRLDADGVRAVLMTGRSVYALRYGFLRLDGSPRKLRGLSLLTADTLGVHIRECNPILGEHVCGNVAFSGVPMDAPAAPASVPVCDLRRRGGWPAPAECPRAADERSGTPYTWASCGVCDPPPFDVAALMRDELGAQVVSVEVAGKVVWSRD